MTWSSAAVRGKAKRASARSSGARAASMTPYEGIGRSKAVNFSKSRWASWGERREVKPLGRQVPMGQLDAVRGDALASAMCIGDG